LRVWFFRHTAFCSNIHQKTNEKEMANNILRGQTSLKMSSSDATLSLCKMFMQSIDILTNATNLWGNLSQLWSQCGPFLLWKLPIHWSHDCVLPLKRWANEWQCCATPLNFGGCSLCFGHVLQLIILSLSILYQTPDFPKRKKRTKRKNGREGKPCRPRFLISWTGKKCLGSFGSSLIHSFIHSLGISVSVGFMPQTSSDHQTFTRYPAKSRAVKAPASAAQDSQFRGWRKTAISCHFYVCLYIYDHLFVYVVLFCVALSIYSNFKVAVEYWNRPLSIVIILISLWWALLDFPRMTFSQSWDWSQSFAPNGSMDGVAMPHSQQIISKKFLDVIYKLLLGVSNILDDCDPYSPSKDM
jgi:hypothetical protein